MKRLLKISFDLSLLSFIPIISWFFLGIIVDKNLINIFTITYPLQFIYYIIKSIFSTGANIHKYKDQKESAVTSGLTIGIIVAIITFSFVLFNVDNYINFMNMDLKTYRVFTIYSILELLMSLIFTMILDKLYYEEKNTLANKYSLLFNLLNFITLITTCLFTKNQIIIVSISLIPISIFTIYTFLKNCPRPTFNLNILKCIKYDSVELFNNIAFFIIFLFGLSNVLEFGEEYAISLTFISLITDTQWDTFDAIATTACIDISKQNFNYRIHRQNAYKLLASLLTTSIIMFALLYNFYKLNLIITLIYFSFELINFVIYPIYRIKTCYLQLNWSALKTTTNKIGASLLRMSLSFINTPYCTGIGQIASSLYQFITVNILFHRHFKVNKDGDIIKRQLN